MHVMRFIFLIKYEDIILQKNTSFHAVYLIIFFYYEKVVFKCLLAYNDTPYPTIGCACFLDVAEGFYKVKIEII